MESIMLPYPVILWQNQNKDLAKLRIVIYLTANNSEKMPSVKSIFLSDNVYVSRQGKNYLSYTLEAACSKLP